MQFLFNFLNPLLFLLLFSFHAHAEQVYFDFVLPVRIQNDNTEVVIKFKYDIPALSKSEGCRLTVKPVISSGSVEIYNLQTLTYIHGSDPPGSMPCLKQELPVKFTGITSDAPVTLFFVIYDTFTGQQYRTPEQKIWGSNYYHEYTSLLNDSLKNPEETSSSYIEGPKISEPPVPINPVKIYLWYLAPAFFLAGLIKLPDETC